MSQSEGGIEITLARHKQVQNRKENKGRGVIKYPHPHLTPQKDNSVLSFPLHKRR